MYQIVLYRTATSPGNVYFKGTSEECNRILYSSAMADWFRQLGFSHWALRT